MPGIRQRRVVAPLIGLTATLLLLPVAGAIAAPEPAVAPGPLVTGTHAVLPGLSLFSRAGEVDPSQPVRVGIALRHPDQAGEAALYHQLYDPASPLYRQFLTPSEYVERFGVDPAVFRGLTGWLGGGGLRLEHVGSARDYVVAEGTASQVESLFHVKLHRYSYQGHEYYANDTNPSVPGNFGITTVLGLDDYPRFHLQQHDIRATGPNVLNNEKPADMWSVYDIPPAQRGQGMSIAVIGEGQPQKAIDDLRLFENDQKLPVVPVRLVCTVNNDCGKDTSGDGEWDIDMQASTGMAPDVSELVLYMAQDLTDLGGLASFDTWVGDARGPLQGDFSVSTCETEPGDPVWQNAAFNPVNPDNNGGAPFGVQLSNQMEPVAEGFFARGNIEGRTLFSSAGDTGASCSPFVPPVNTNGALAQPDEVIMGYPAVSPHVVGVGGTVMYDDGSSPKKRFLEYAWPYTGGGSSGWILQPDYQQGISNLVGRCITGPQGETSATGQPCRGIPDVAAISGDLTTGYYVFSGGKPSSGGGTSLSSPLWVGMWATINAASHLKRGLGFMNETIYPLEKGSSTTYSHDFFDVTVGNNFFYPALPGWDYVSGWGVPDVANLTGDVLATVRPAGSPSPTPVPTPSPSSAPSPSPSPQATPVSHAPLPNTGGPASGWAALALLALALPPAALMARRRPG